MSIEFLPPVAPIQSPLASLGPLAGSEAVASNGTFGALVTDGLRHLGEQLRTSETDLQRLATGDVQNLHQIMIGLEETRISFQLMLQVRNRVLESFQEVMRMQV